MEKIQEEAETVDRQTAEVCEFIELLKKLTDEEKQQVRCIMLGMTLMRRTLETKTE